MANTDGPFGLRPLEYANGTPWSGKARKYYLDATLNETIYIGDPVVLAGSADASGKYASVKLATLAATNYVLGPVVAFEQIPTSPERKYHVAQTEQYCYVADDPDLIFEIQADSATDIAADDIGSNGIMVRTHSGDTTTGLSGVELDESSLAGADATQMLLVVGLVDRPDNELATHAKVKVMINSTLHQYAIGYGA